jgi:hypothetical protein
MAKKRVLDVLQSCVVYVAVAPDDFVVLQANERPSRVISLRFYLAQLKNLNLKLIGMKLSFYIGLENLPTASRLLLSSYKPTARTYVGFPCMNC